MELFFEIVAEFLLQLVLELFADAGLRTYDKLKDPSERPMSAMLSLLTVLGAVAGAISLLLFREAFIQSPVLRAANLALTPLLVAFIVAQIGRGRERRGRSRHAIETYVGGYVFALAFAAVRYLFAH